MSRSGDDYYLGLWEREAKMHNDRQRHFGDWADKSEKIGLDGVVYRDGEALQENGDQKSKKKRSRGPEQSCKLPISRRQIYSGAGG
jgi:hypothetical protein